MISQIADFAPEGTESGVGLALQNEDGLFLFFLGGTRHLSFCPPGELFYGGIGGHREEGEGWLACAHREAKEEIGTDIDILSSSVTWHVPQNGPVGQVEVGDRPRPLALYEMIHPPGAPRAGELYRIVIYKARLRGTPKDLPLEELQGVVGLTSEQVILGPERSPTLAELVDEGAVLVAGGEDIDRQLRLYPLGTARALASILGYAGMV